MKLFLYWNTVRSSPHVTFRSTQANPFPGIMAHCQGTPLEGNDHGGLLRIGDHSVNLKIKGLSATEVSIKGLGVMAIFFISTHTEPDTSIIDLLIARCTRGGNFKDKLRVYSEFTKKNHYRSKLVSFIRYIQNNF